jgi:cation diffusion facilitator family transporter
MQKSADLQLKHERNIKAAQGAATVAAIAAGFLAIGKLSLFFMTGSLVIALSTWDSSIDVFISFINRTIVKYSRQNADENHPYGHGKVESIAALGQGSLITGGALVILGSSCQKLYEYWQGKFEPILETWYTVFFFILAALISLGVTHWLRYHGTKCSSPALLADSTHYRVDVASNLGSAGSLAAIMLTGNLWLDPLIAGIFSFYIGWNGFRLLKSSINELMDHDIHDDVKKRALNIISECSKEIIDIHNFRSRKSGYRYFFDFHITLPATLQFAEVHGIVQSIEEELQDKFEADVVVRADPDSLATSEYRVVAFSRRN